MPVFPSKVDGCLEGNAGLRCRQEEGGGGVDQKVAQMLQTELVWEGAI